MSWPLLSARYDVTSQMTRSAPPAIFNPLIANKTFKVRLRCLAAHAGLALSLIRHRRRRRYIKRHAVEVVPELRVIRPIRGNFETGAQETHFNVVSVQANMVGLPVACPAQLRSMELLVVRHLFPAKWNLNEKLSSRHEYPMHLPQCQRVVVAVLQDVGKQYHVHRIAR